MKICEVAHDMQSQVTKYVTGSLKLVNSYDTWHGQLQVVQNLCMCMQNVISLVCVYSYVCTLVGTKNVAKEMKKITQGTKKDKGTKWFPEFADKSE